MTIYKLTVKAVRERFMEPPLHDTSEHYIAAYSYDQAHSYVWAMLNRAGWKIDEIRGKEVYLIDIRDSCDHVTD